MASNPRADAIARIDVERAKRIGQMLAPADAPEFDKDPDDMLLDMSQLNGRTLWEEYEEEMASYATSPFDPKGDRIRFYPCGVTLWSGFPGTGKTTLLRQQICHLLRDEHGVFVASLEEHPKRMLVRLSATAAGVEKANPNHIQWFIDLYGERLKIWAKIGLAKHRTLLAVMRKLAGEGVSHAVIDSLMKLDISSQDFEAQRVFANLLQATAHQTRLHIHLVAHPKKPQTGDQEPDINDVGGAKEIGGIADNVLFVKRRELETSYNGLVSGMKIYIRKQREGMGTLGEISGFFHRDKRQFHLGQWDEPIRYLPDGAYL